MKDNNNKNTDKKSKSEPPFSMVIYPTPDEEAEFIDRTLSDAYNNNQDVH